MTPSAPKFTRRQAGGALASLAAGLLQPGMAFAAGGGRWGAPRPFSRDLLVERARRLQRFLMMLRRVGVEAATELLMPYRGTSDVAMYADLKQRFGFTETPEELTQRKSELFQKVMHERGVVPIEGILPLIEKTAAMRK